MSDTAPGDCVSAAIALANKTAPDGYFLRLYLNNGQQLFGGVYAPVNGVVRIECPEPDGLQVYFVNISAVAYVSIEP